MKSQKLDENAAGMALSAVFGGWYALCALALYAFQSPTMMLGRNMFHGVSFQQPAFSLTGVLLGLFAWVALAYASGYVFARLYNDWSK